MGFMILNGGQFQTGACEASESLDTEVIDHLLDTPELAQSPVVQRDERGRYRFVDPTLQSRSIGQKALLRMDAAQARAVKQQLRAIRSAITR